ncbi:coiled-coil domain-containing protein 153 [Protopterus annectens]|uniref:coiled-coil domain-containing protein 153 n=1 Tax=Protopterus annectens TaxID=7888 RepID=UPI001CFB3336|nr:coiled-coil domain-containing protein 153 [Protopterus annectens]
MVPFVSLSDSPPDMVNHDAPSHDPVVWTIPTVENVIEEKFKKASHEVDVLKDHLALRRDLVRQAQANNEEFKLKMLTLEKELDEERGEKKAISSDLTRQYKTLQADMVLRIHKLQTEVSHLQQQLESCREELKATQGEKERLVLEKDEVIAELQNKIDNMETDYERILHDGLDKLQSKIAAAKLQWEQQATTIHFEQKRLLLDFGLNPLDI